MTRMNVNQAALLGKGSAAFQAHVDKRIPLRAAVFKFNEALDVERTDPPADNADRLTRFEIDTDGTVIVSFTENATDLWTNLIEEELSK